MSDTFVDSNVLVDILHDDPEWEAWSVARLEAARAVGNLIINPLVYAEICAGYPTQRQVDQALSSVIYRRENLPWDAAFNAARAFVTYRRAGGTKRSLASSRRSSQRSSTGS